MANGPQKASLGRATPAVAVTAAVLLVVAGVTFAAVGERDYGRQKFREAEVQARILASTVTAALSFSDRAAAQEYVNALSVNPEILSAAVYDASGSLFAGFSRAPDLRPDEHLSARVQSSADGTLAVVAPVVEESREVGSVSLRVLKDPVARRLVRFSLIALLAGMAAVVVGVLGAAHATLTRANADLQRQSLELAAANRSLLQQIDEREKAEQALRQAQKMEAIGQLTGGVAHDFNNLLQIVMSSLSMLKRRAGRWTMPVNDAHDFNRLVDLAMNGGERAAGLTRQLLAFARRQPLEPKRIDVNRLVAGMSELLRRTLGESISVETVLSGGLWPTFADANQLESAIVNLAVNARDAMEGRGRLTIETQNAHLDDAYARAHSDLAAGQYVMVAVTDTGCGMTPDTLAKAFEPFFTTKDVGHGTGLGLSQVYGFVRQSGGHVKIYSEPGMGTTMKLYLPRLVGSREESCADADEPAAPRGASHETVLVVEDEDDVRAFSVGMLRELGYTVVEARDGRSALRVLESDSSVRLLFTDVGLPGGMNGRQIADEARRLRPEVRVLFTSGYTRNAIVHGDRLDAGVALLSKPFTFPSLAEKVREVLGGADGA